MISATAWSGIAGPLPVGKSWTWAASVSGGFAVARAGETETFFLTPGIEKSYVAQKDNNTLATGEVFFWVFIKGFKAKVRCNSDWLCQQLVTLIFRVSFGMMPAHFLITTSTNIRCVTPILPSKESLFLTIFG